MTKHRVLTPDRVISDVSSRSNFALEVAKGNIDGITPIQILGLNPEVGTAFEDLWCPCGSLIYPTSAETWEIVSDSADDSETGTGARTVEITTLDEDYVEQETVTVTLNGLTPVTISGTHFRHMYSRVKTWGSTGWNKGKILIRVAGGGDCRTCIDIQNGVGINVTQDSHYTVQAGKTLYLTQIVINTTKDHDITARMVYRLFGEGGFLTKGSIGVYQNSYILPFTNISRIFTEKTDIKYIAKSNNTEVPVTSVMEGYLIDN